MPIYVPATLDDNGFRRGFAAAETGIYLETMTESFSDEVDEQLNHAGTPVGFVHGFDERVTISCSGEVNNTTGIMAVAFGTAHSFQTNVTTTAADDPFQGSVAAGGHYLRGMTVEQGRTAKRTASFEFVSYASNPVT